MSYKIYKEYRVFREQVEFDPDIDYTSASNYTLPQFILIKKQKLKTCKFCIHWFSRFFSCGLHPKDIAPFYSDFTCKDWEGDGS